MSSDEKYLNTYVYNNMIISITEDGSFGLLDEAKTRSQKKTAPWNE